MLYRVFALTLLSVLAIPALSQTFDLPLRLRYAIELFDARRYQNAELVLNAIYKEYQPTQTHHFDSYLSLLDYLARSISQQGRTDRVRQLLQERHVLIARHYDTRGYEFANSMSRLAEALYREGDRQLAISFTDHALKLYRDLNPKPIDAIDLADTNRLQYKVAQFSTSMLPMDLSDFYTRCEQMSEHPSGTLAGQPVEQVFADYVEVGVDYLPAGSWSDYFDIIAVQQREKLDETARFRMFIPATVETLRDELCIVMANNKRMVSAESALD